MAAPCLSPARKPPLIKWGTDPGSSFGPFHCVLLLSNYETIRAADTSVSHKGPEENHHQGVYPVIHASRPLPNFTTKKLAPQY